MIAAAEGGTLCLDKLEAMTCVCSVGLDMIAVPGDTSAATISAIIADEAAIGMVNTRPPPSACCPPPPPSCGTSTPAATLRRCAGARGNAVFLIYSNTA